MRIFLDTTVLAGALTTRGLCAEVLAIVFEIHEPLTCRPILRDLETLLNEKLQVPPAITDDYIQLLTDNCTIAPLPKAPVARLEEHDDVPVAVSETNQVEVILTGDKALLALNEIESIPILSPADFWHHLSDSAKKPGQDSGARAKDDPSFMRDRG